MKQKTEYQVVHGDGDVESFPNLKEATHKFRLDEKATELRRVVWKIADDETWETAGEGEREEITIQERQESGFYLKDLKCPGVKV